MERLSNLIAENKKYIIFAIVSGMIVYFLLLRNYKMNKLSMKGGAAETDLILSEAEKKYLTPEELIIVNGGQEEIKKYFQSVLNTVKNIVACKDVKDETIKSKCLGDNYKYYVLSVNRNDKEGLGDMYHTLVRYSANREPTLVNVKMNFLRILANRMSKGTTTSTTTTIN